MSTYLEVINQARRLLADSADQAYNEQELLAFANEGVARFAVLTQACVDYNTITPSSRFVSKSNILKTGQQDIVCIWRVLALQGGQQYILPQAAVADSKLRQSSPTRWLMTASGILLDSTTIPSSLQLELIYSFLPIPATSANAALPVPVQWMTAIVSYTAACAALQSKDVGLANGFMEQFNGYVGAAKVSTSASVISSEKSNV